MASFPCKKTISTTKLFLRFCDQAPCECCIAEREREGAPARPASQEVSETGTPLYTIPLPKL